MAKKTAPKKSNNDIYWLLLTVASVGLSLGIIALFVSAPDNAASMGILLFYPLFIFAFFACVADLAIYLPLTLLRHHNDLRKTTIAHFLFVLSFFYLNIIKIFPAHDRTAESYNHVIWSTIGFFIPFYIVRKVCWKYFSKHQLVHKLTLLVTAIGYLFFLYFN